MTHSWYTIAQSAYAAYQAVMGQWDTQGPVPRWSQLSPQQQAAIEAAVRQADELQFPGAEPGNEHIWAGWEVSPDCETPPAPPPNTGIRLVVSSGDTLPSDPDVPF